MSALNELSTAVKTRRAEMGLTQTALARASGLSRATVNQVERGAIKDLSLTRAGKLLAALGLAVSVTEPHAARAPTGRTHAPALELAARTAGISYRNGMSARQLRTILTTGEVPGQLSPHVYTLLDEASISLLAAVADQLHQELGIARAQVWKTMRKLAQQFKSYREIWR